MMAEIDSNLLEGIIKVAEVVLVPLLWKVYTSLTNLTTEVGNLKTTLIGTDGKNGIRSRVRRLELKQEKIALVIAASMGETSFKVDEDHDE